MAQHIGLQRETEDGELIDYFNEGKSVDFRIFDHIDPIGACIRFIDPYGDTIFNQLQIPELTSELEKIRFGTKDKEFKTILTKTIEYINGAIELHTHVRFVGD